MEMKKEELDKIIANHVKWLKGDGGKRADLEWTDLRVANLEGANLHRANIGGVKLEDAILEGANLPTGIYQIVGAGRCNRCTTYDAVNDRVICGCWNDGKGNHLDSFTRRVEEIYGAKGEEPNLKYYTEYMSAVAFFKAMKELKKLKND